MQWMPASAGFIAYVDVDSLVSSPLREAWEGSRSRSELEGMDTFRQATGMDPWNDFRALSLSARAEDGGRQWGVALSGDLDRERLISVIEEHETLARESHGDTTLYILSDKSKRSDEPHALAFPGPTIALFGTPEHVRTMLDTAAGREPSAEDGPLGSWLLDLPPSETFWCAGSAEAGMNRLLSSAPPDAPSIPPLRSFAVSGRLGPDVNVIARGDASDPDAALRLAEVIRGFVALTSLKNQGRPEYQTILDSVYIEAFDNRVEVSCSVPYETVTNLVSKRQD
jgi:hypothetical protein